MRIGVIADDFTGGTDIASFFVKGGLSTVQFSGVPEGPLDIEADAVVVSLKSRSCDKSLAVEQSLEALRFLQQIGCKQFYFKYCSTFDSTAHGNIGPVTDALMDALDISFTVVCPSLPLNGRCVFNGNLFVNGVLLSESGMRNHPVTPMLDSNLVRVMNAQAQGESALVNYQIVDQGPEQILAAYKNVQLNGKNYAVLDAFNEQQLANIAASCRSLPLITGGSGLAHHIAKNISDTKEPRSSTDRVPSVAPSVVLSGSCSETTNLQVAEYMQCAQAFAVDTELCLKDNDYAQRAADWVMHSQGQRLAPLVYATANVDRLKEIQQRYGAKEASLAVEKFFGDLAEQLSERGIRNFIVAGGETSGVVTQHLQLSALSIGKEIAPGVPWVFSLDNRFALALKSGNFGTPHFFTHAQEMFHD